MASFEPEKQFEDIKARLIEEYKTSLAVKTDKGNELVVHDVRIKDNKNTNDIKKQRDAKKTKRFEGTFLEYLELVKDNPQSIKLAHRRLYETIKDRGLETLDVDSEKYRDIFNFSAHVLPPYFPAMYNHITTLYA